MDYPHKELTGNVIKAAIAVHQELRPGLSEKFYERALCIELAEMGIKFSQQMSYDVNYRGKYLGNLIPDLVIEDSIIVDTKCVDSFSSAHESQMLGYLNITGLAVGLLLNFKTWPLGKKRMVLSKTSSKPPL